MIDAIAAHLGQGVIQVLVTSSLPANLRRFEIQTASTLNGIYEKFSNRFFFGTIGFLYGYLVGTVVYMRIRAEMVAGEVVTFSDWHQVRCGEIRYPKALMLCEAPAGSVILKGSLFTAKQTNQRAVGFVNDTEIRF